MLFKKSKTAASSSLNDDQKLRAMIENTQAVIEFKVDGTIIRANKVFLDTLGYTLEEIEGQHHSMFVYPSFVRKDAYKQMWRDLAAGNPLTDQFPRLRKDGEVVWIQATYAPFFNEDGTVDRIVKIASNITKRRMEILGIAAALEQLRNGDLTYRCAPSDIDDIGRLSTAYNEAVSSLQNTIRTVREVADGVTRTAGQLNDSSSELSQRTENQAATLEETAAAVEELTATVRSSADGAREVEDNVRQARVTAEKSGQVVSDAVKAMSKIEESSQSISKIISVIDDIAFQTNLLALNAGVEAARAGEAGRGFAVVASEVRNLALRSADAAGEIKGLIDQSATHVSDGVTLVGRTGTELEAIISSVNSISENVSVIARGAEEQAVTLSEINSGIGHLDEVTQNNVAMVEETTGASQTLASDASVMSKEIANFVSEGEIKIAKHVAPIPNTPPPTVEPELELRTGT
ncbi:methyl-accepting chemotaxis sensory transducer with Pas/Pac sensor [Ruegeria sp. TM1040]|jgi:methyl-accepting chemotaxis protein|uniref:methyl-accepting chemotaxis protein n=1 Tax=Ruegeria sp. (strain TM1040) TaxID=292414 RepID=UPI0000462410|nr:PAS domain-containing methyl-accepting chemotaxis protein [Ruegeria sp. TM1040]ABF64220.1 methyl-accepting chemotaxis sensory transducer with Pas/Pac sensor [Ruegeria sp. TM1040]